MQAAAGGLALTSGRWFHSPAYDLLLTLGVLGLALLLGGVAQTSSTAFHWVLAADIWLLAHPHVAAMYTRVAFDRKSARKHWFLLSGLPLLTLLATTAAARLGGVVFLITAYYYWQTWHYTRQSYGIARALSRGTTSGPDRFTTAVLFAFPAWGVLHRASQEPSEFYGSAIALPEVPSLVPTLMGFTAVGLLVAWMWVRCATSRRGAHPLSSTHVLFVLSHVAITVVSYVLIDEITHGWLFINIWHNAQYLVFVWAFNAKRFEGGIDPNARWLSWFSQPHRKLSYLILCAGLGTLIYLALGSMTYALEPHVASVVLIAHLTVNFHHYLVDSVIWRRKARRES